MLIGNNVCISFGDHIIKKRMVRILITGLTLPHCCTRLSQDTEFHRKMSWSLPFNDLRLEVVLLYKLISSIIDTQFLFS